MKKSLIYAALSSLLLLSPVLAKTVTPDSPAEVAGDQQSGKLVEQGEALLDAGNPLAAEESFRAALALRSWNAAADPGLAEALTLQGKTAEALQVYRALIYQYPRNLSSAAQEMRTVMGFAMLLSRTGQWREAVAVYEKALPETRFGDAPKLDVHFDPNMPMSTQLQVMGHVAIGLQYFGSGRDKEAFTEFERSLRLDPDSVFANYYYGYSWGAMMPSDKAKFGSFQQAKTALEKAVKLAKGPLKDKAQKALMVAMNTKTK